MNLIGGFGGTETQASQRSPKTHVTILDGNRSGSVLTGPATGAPLIVIGFTIRNGLAVNGGGISSRGVNVWSDTNIITGNTATGDGGGVYYGPGDGGGVTFCTVTGNTAEGRGGGIYYCPTTSGSSVAQNFITGNKAAVGGGFYCNRSAILHQNIISGNSAIEGGGICCDVSATAKIYSNIISGNSSSGGGGGIACQLSASPTIVNNTIVLNSAAYGGGLWSASNAASTVANNIISFNSSGIRKEGGAPSLLNNCVYGNADSNYSGLPDQTGISGNISADPKLAGMLYVNSHIQPDSPCRDAGNDAASTVTTQDFYRAPRIQGAHVDIGGAESDGATYPAGPTLVVRVSPSGDDTNDGSSWALAKRTIQAALDAAAVDRKGAEMIVTTTLGAGRSGRRKASTRRRSPCGRMSFCSAALPAPRRCGRSGTGRATRPCWTATAQAAWSRPAAGTGPA